LSYRLTYALTEEEIITLEFCPYSPDMAAAVEEAFEMIEKEHGAESVLNLRAISLLKLGPDE